MSVDLYQNGSLLNEKYMPEELLSKIFCHCEHETLLSCQLVCKHWFVLIQDFVWRKKAEQTIGHNLPVDNEIPWTDYYLICDKKPFNKNLLKNHSGNEGVEKHWTVVKNNGNKWAVECPPVGVPPLPDDPVFERNNCCFVTSYGNCSKYQVIDLAKEGISEYVMDTLQPTIKISEWYSCRWDCAALYKCKMTLLGETDNQVKELNHMCKFKRKIIKDEERNQWYKFTRDFSNYGKGIRRIAFIHGGHDKQNWAGHYGSKMAGACIKLELPQSTKKEDSSSS